MRRKLLAIVSAVVVLSLSVTPVFAQSIRLSGVSFRLGSLIADGKVRLASTHPEDTHVELHATGSADLTCQDGDFIWTEYDVHVEATGSVLVEAHQFNRRGLASFTVETGDPAPMYENACEGHTVVSVGFVFWDHASVSAQAGDLHTQQNFTCETTPECVTCKRTRGS